MSLRMDSLEARIVALEGALVIEHSGEFRTTKGSEAFRKEVDRRAAQWRRDAKMDWEKHLKD